MKRLYALNLSEESRVLSVTYDEYAPADQPRVTELPDGNVADYKYVEGKFVHAPLPVVEPEVVPTQLDMIEAQVTYTAMMTDTLLEVSQMYEKIKKFYSMGLWTGDMVKTAVDKGLITNEECAEILNENAEVENADE